MTKLEQAASQYHLGTDHPREFDGREYIAFQAGAKWHEEEMIKVHNEETYKIIEILKNDYEPSGMIAWIDTRLAGILIKCLKILRD